MMKKKRRQLELDFVPQRRLGVDPGAARERRDEVELDLGYARLRQLYEFGKLLGGYQGPASVPPLFQLLARTVPLRLVMLVEVTGGAARISAARAAGVPDAELDSAASHARACTARLAGLDQLRGGAVDIDAEPLPSARKATGRGPFAAVPLLLDRRDVCGALYARGTLGESDLAFLSAAADQISLALDRHAAWQREVRLRERAEGLDRAQKELVAVVSHDLRNPLGAVLLGLSTLKRWPQLDARTVRDSLDTIHRAAERASRLVHDLLDVARIDAGVLQLEFETLDVGAMVREAADLMRPLLADGEIRCDTQVEEALPHALGDRERILQVLSNLLGNARKFAPPGSTVSLLTFRDQDEILCCVADEGPGIPEHELPRVFDRYFQGEHGPTTAGAGLGLSIAQGIVEAHEGRIWVESAPGRGSRFFFSLPISGSID